MSDRGDLHEAGAPERAAHDVLGESVGWLALEATRRTYADDPSLWRLGEFGRARTLEDHGHHLTALAAGTDAAWAAHLRYCVTLFAGRGLPIRWLSEAFATLDALLGDVLDGGVTADARRRLRAAPDIMRSVAVDEGIDLNAPTRFDP